MGGPGAGRSDALEALTRVLDPDVTRSVAVSELDFYARRTERPFEVEVVIGDLGAELEQRFFDYLEVWDGIENRIVDEAESPEEIDRPQCEFVLRLCYRGEWLPQEQRGEGRVYYPKTSDASAGVFVYPRRADVEELGYARIRWAGGKLFDLGVRSPFRRLVERASGEDFCTAVNAYLEDIENSAGRFTNASQVKAAIEEVIGPLRMLLGVEQRNVDELIRFTPEGGAVSGLLRSLAPSLDLGDGAGSLPAVRRGSTVITAFGLAEALALAAESGGILAIDDLGDGLDAASAAHMTSQVLQLASQVWITTRLPAVAEIVDMEKIVRLGRDSNGKRVAFHGRVPASKGERIAARHWGRNILPALSYDAVIVVEGAHDLTTLQTLALRLFRESGVPLPTSRRAVLVSAGGMGSGGSSGVPRVTQLAREMGLRTVGVIDWDRTEDADAVLEKALACADVVVRLPQGVAIERAIVQGIADGTLRKTIQDTSEVANVEEPADIANVTGGDLESLAIDFLKRSGGLHGVFLQALPSSDLPVVASAILSKSIEAAADQSRGLIQL
jgi:hypothetical protein